MANEVVLTKTGYEKLQKELENLKKVERPAIIERIKNARELGDLSENADYSNAREEQSFIEGRIQEIEEKLKVAKVVDSTGNCSEVCVGHKVHLDCSGKKEEYHIVGDDESDPLNGKISVNSPIGKAVVGKKPGEVVKIQIPAGVKECKILKIG